MEQETRQTSFNFLPTFSECQRTPIKVARNAGKHYTDNLFKLGAEETS